MKDLPLPFRMLSLGLQTARLIGEVQTVIALRSMGAMGLWPVGPSESLRMITEKGPALLRSAGAAGAAALAGHSPELIAGAALKPIRKVTRSNARRLSRKGRRTAR